MKPTYIMLAEGGMTIEQVAKVFGISAPTFYRWMREHPTLAEAVQKGRDAWDNRVAEECLKKRVTGFEYNEVTTELREAIDPLTGEIQAKMTPVKIVTKTVVPDVAAISKWLNNRDPDRWKDKILVEDTASDLAERLRKAEERINGKSGESRDTGCAEVEKED